MITINKGISVIKTKKGNLSLRITDSDGSIKTLHSVYDPEAEAANIVEAFEFNGKGLLVVLGLGLAYHLKELSKKYPETDIIVVESEQEIYELADKHGLELNARTRLFVGIPPRQVLKEITNLQMKEGILPVSVFTLAPAVSVFSEYYGPIIDSLNKITSVRLWDRIKYPKFRQDTQKVVLIDTGYFLVKEAEKALLSLNHKVRRVPVGKTAGGDVVLSQFVEAILDFKPDFILTINHLGFDEEGALTSFFRSIEMPVASWYVDSPRLIVQAFKKNVSPYVSMFLWDRTYIDDMKKMGFESVNYLTLGTDIDVFRPMKIKGQGQRLRDFVCDVGFVGNSMVGPVNEYMSKFDREFHPLIDRLAEKVAAGESFGIGMLPYNLDVKQKMDFEAAVLWKATLLYRRSCIEKLNGFSVRVHGDTGWKDLLDSHYDLKPPLNYYNELPKFYNACKINFNATHLQMSEAVNQRVFDVPACGAFLLTDYQKCIDELFDAGKEITVYRDKEEVPGLVRFYLDNPGERERIAGRGRERVLRDHTYGHRLGSMIRSMRERYA
ncbi:MAG: hypothetical protein C4560_13855 [Nitrospiraceae bacterium]|nr:MAG: hypothetical protein C4560_13855 [Nitrospiraceae bacterium]